MKVLVTGAAGFIGFHVSKHLLERGDTVIGLDNFTPYYDVSLKEARLQELQNLNKDLVFEKLDLLDNDALSIFCSEHQPDRIIHLAAQAGVRYSIEHPRDVIQANVVTFMNILDQANELGVEHFVYASSSSVYGSNQDIPFRVTDNVDHPISMYAATKKSNELMAHVYSHLYQLPSTGLRFFTVYGPWGRPDMSAFLFAKAIYSGETIKLFNHGNHRRDFTYIDDIVSGVIKVLDSPPETKANHYALYNIGNNQPVELMEFLRLIEQNIGKKAITELVDMQPGDVEETYADIDAISNDLGYNPTTSIDIGIAKLIDWYKSYYGQK